MVQTTDNKVGEYAYSSSVGSRGEGFYYTPPSGQSWRCVLTTFQGETYISNFLPPSMDNGQDSALATSSLTKKIEYGDSINTAAISYRAFAIDETRRRKNYRSNRYVDYIPGDIILKSLENNMMGVLRGGVNISKVSELCQMLLFSNQDLMRLISRNFELFTDMGTFSIKSEKGGTYLEVNLSSNREGSPKTRDANAEIQLKIGNISVGSDNESFIMTFEYKTPGAESFLFMMGVDGSVSYTIPKDFFINVKDEALVTIGRNLGLFAGKLINMDANERIKIEAGSKNEFDEEGSLVQKEDGMGFEAVKEYARMGDFKDIEVLVKGGKVLTGKTSGHKPVVQKPHLDDHYNKLCEGLGDLMFAQCMGDLGIPVPLAIRTSQIKLATSLYFSLQDKTNYTKETEST